MASYLLLRSNKKSGPYSLHDLVNFGLKPYDLVWVDGKSAAWRYPSEIEELKPYAPGVEEQPYDRFFKKNTEEEHFVLQQQKQQAAKEQIAKETPVPVEPVAPVVQKLTPIEEKYEKYIPKKSVFVTLPGQKTVAVQKPPVQTPQPVKAVQETVEAVPVIKVTENPEAKIKYSQPLDEIKEMYVKTLHERKTKIARKSFLMANLKKAAVVAGLVAIGVLAGFIIRSGSDKKTLAEQKNNQSFPSAAAMGLDPAAENSASQNTGGVNDQSTVLNHQRTEDAPTENIKLTPELEQRLLELEKRQFEQPGTNKRSVMKPGAPEDDVAETEPVKPLPVETDPVSGERNRKLRNENNSNEQKAVMKPIVKKNSPLSGQVSITSNDYKRVAFGGIRNLELTVTNDSKYVLDKVTVELQYLKPSEEPLKTELVQFHSVSPNGSMTMRIRDTNRGIKVAYKIIDIQSAQTETAMSGF
jgi:hypothetical protein